MSLEDKYVEVYKRKGKVDKSYSYGRYSQSMDNMRDSQELKKRGETLLIKKEKN